MKLPRELTTVTTFSKYLALSLFVFVPILAFFLGMRYSQLINNEMLGKVAYTWQTSTISPSNVPDTDVTLNTSLSPDKEIEILKDYSAIDFSDKSYPTQTHSLWIIDKATKSFTKVFSKTGGPAAELSIPENNWSNDSKYFIISYGYPDGSDLFLFRSNGQLLDGKPYLNLDELSLQQLGLRLGHNLKWNSASEVEVSTFTNLKSGPKVKFNLVTLKFHK